MNRKVLIALLSLVCAVSCSFVLVGCGGSGDSDEPAISYTYNYHLYGDVVLSISTWKTGLDDKYMIRDGYIFEGTFTRPDGQGEMFFNRDGWRVDNAEIKAGMDIYAHWRPKTYTLCLKNGNENFRVIQNVTYDAELVALDVPPAKTGMVFAGWGLIYDNNKITLTTDGDGKFLPNKNVFNSSNGFVFDHETSIAYINAIFDYERYDITLNYNGLAENQTITAYYDHTIEHLPDLTFEDNNEFIGWSYVNSVNEYTLYDGEKITGPVTLYAIVLRYRDFDIFDGEGNRLATKRIYDNGETIRVSELELKLPAGYKAVNWYNNASMSGSSRITSVSYNMSTNALYADIVPIQYTAVLVTDGATVSSDLNFTYTCEDIVPLPSAEKTNYVFIGWCLDEELTSPVIKRISAGTTGDLKLYPKFKGVDVTLNLNAQNGNSGVKTATCEYGQNYSLEIPTKTGYTFLGWYDAAKDGTRYTTAKGKSVNAADFTAPLTLYAHWIINEYTVIYLDNEGNDLTSQTYEHGQILAFPSDPTSETLMFSGWYNRDYSEPFADGVKVLGDMTLYALFVDSLEIADADGLKAIAQNPTGNYHLSADINLNGETWTPIDDFKGVLDGKGHRIFNFTLSATAVTDNFGFVRVNSGTIKNLTFDDFGFSVTFTFGYDAHVNSGVIAGENNGVISNCHVTNRVCLQNVIAVNSTDRRYLDEFGTHGYSRYAQFVTGIIAGANNKLVIDCRTNVESIVKYKFDLHAVAKERYNMTCIILDGGIVGWNYGSISRCNSKSTVNLDGDASIYIDRNSGDAILSTTFNVGSIAGVNDNGLISSCLAEGTRKGVCRASVDAKYSDWLWMGRADSYMHVGGIVGVNNARIASSSVTGNTEGSSNHTMMIGGAIGENNINGIVENCYVSGGETRIIGGKGDIGGFIGLNFGKANACYADSKVIAGINDDKSIGGFIGSQGTTGSVASCWFAGSVTVVSSSGTGKFFGYNGGIIRKCYYSDSVTLTVNGVSADGSSDGAAEKSESELSSRELLIDELFWNDEIWVLHGENKPTLAWQA